MPFNYFSRLRTAIQSGNCNRAIGGRDGELLDSVEVLIWQGKFRLCNIRLFHSLRFSTLAELQVLLQPGTVLAARSDLLSANRKRNFSVVGVISRSFSVPSVSGPSFQVCGYHIDRVLFDTGQSTVGRNFQNRLMAGCAPRAVSGYLSVDRLTSRYGCRSLPSNSACMSHGIRSIDSCLKVSMSLYNKRQPKDYTIQGYLLYNVAKRWFNFSPDIQSSLRGFHSSSLASSSAGMAPDVSIDSGSREEQFTGSTDSSEQYVFLLFWKFSRLFLFSQLSNCA